MKTKDYILVISLIVNAILGFWLYDISQPDSELMKELEQSKGREQILLQQDSLLTISIDSIRKENAIKDSLLQIQPKEITVIKEYYYEKRDSIITVSYTHLTLPTKRIV